MITIPKGLAETNLYDLLSKFDLYIEDTYPITLDESSDFADLEGLVDNYGIYNLDIYKDYQYSLVTESKVDLRTLAFRVYDTIIYLNHNYRPVKVHPKLRSKCISVSIPANNTSLSNVTRNSILDKIEDIINGLFSDLVISISEIESSDQYLISATVSYSRSSSRKFDTFKEYAVYVTQETNLLEPGNNSITKLQANQGLYSDLQSKFYSTWSTRSRVVSIECDDTQNGFVDTNLSSFKLCGSPGVFTLGVNSQYKIKSVSLRVKCAAPSTKATFILGTESIDITDKGYKSFTLNIPDGTTVRELEMQIVNGSQEDLYINISDFKLELFSDTTEIINQRTLESRSFSEIDKDFLINYLLCTKGTKLCRNLFLESSGTMDFKLINDDLFSTLDLEENYQLVSIIKTLRGSTFRDSFDLIIRALRELMFFTDTDITIQTFKQVLDLTSAIAFKYTQLRYNYADT